MALPESWICSFHNTLSFPLSIFFLLFFFPTQFPGPVFVIYVFSLLLFLSSFIKFFLSFNFCFVFFVPISFRSNSHINMFLRLLFFCILALNYIFHFFPLASLFFSIFFIPTLFLYFLFHYLSLTVNYPFIFTPFPFFFFSEFSPHTRTLFFHSFNTFSYIIFLISTFLSWYLPHP